MSKATENKLSTLHSAVADALIAQVEHTVKDTAFDDEGNETVLDTDVYTAPPATLAAAIKFLKDNDITCDHETADNMGKLEEALANKQRRSRMGSAKAAAKLKVV